MFARHIFTFVVFVSVVYGWLDPVYRCKSKRDHIYTTSSNCENAPGYSRQGDIQGYVNGPNDDVAIYRCVSNKDFLMTATNNCEGSRDYRLVGLVFSFSSRPDSSHVPFYRFVLPSGVHFFTLDKNCEGLGGHLESILGYINVLPAWPTVGSWVQIGSGLNTYSLTESVTTSQSKTTTWSKQTTFSVSSGFSFLGIKLDSSYSENSGISQSVTSAVSETTSRTISVSCTNAPDGTLKALYQWSMYITGTDTTVDLLDFICRPVKDGPPCPLGSCYNVDCTSCGNWHNGLTVL